MSTRKGSALLIVLGMLSFMVVSAVGFSMFMRQSRLPSSYLRRNVASRYLVKAALANAIEELDCGWMSLYDIGERDDTEQGRFFGIYDDPYPGSLNFGQEKTVDENFINNINNMNDGFRTVPKLRSDASNPPKYTYCENGDFWYKRVFCPFGPLPSPEDDEDDAADWAAPTVPTLTLEALAYLPPAIIDDVRDVSRVTRTAQWHALPYEAGRYAYTAVNVSDLFDINRLRASESRDSGPNRVTMAPLASNTFGDPSDIDAEGAAPALDACLTKLESGSVDAPYVSLADFTLVNVGSDYSPFSKYVGYNLDEVYQKVDQKKRAANAMFITDSWFPPTNSVGRTDERTYDLTCGHQPFKPETFGKDSDAVSFLEVLLQMNTQDQVGEIFEKNLGMSLACLYDYLDRDSRPISFCLPTVEAVPMVVGVSAPSRPDFKLEPTLEDVGEDEGEFTVAGKVTKVGGETVAANATVRRTGKLKGITSFGENAMVKVLVTFPFKRMKLSERLKFNNLTMRGLMRICLAESGMNSRLAADGKMPGWTKTNVEHGKATDGVVTFVSDEEIDWEEFIKLIGNDVMTSDQVVDDSSFELHFPKLDVINGGMPVYWDVEEKIVSVDQEGTFEPDDKNQIRASFKSLGKLSEVPAALRPLAVDGKVWKNWDANTWEKDKAGEDGAKDMSKLPIVEDKFRFQVSVWIQILKHNDEGDVEVVDMVPARLEDDDAVEGWGKAKLPAGNFTLFGEGIPQLNFQSSTDIEYDKIDDETLKVAFTKYDWSTLYAVDPRYNFAPENWYASTEEMSGIKWLDMLKENYFGKDNGDGFIRDRDPFMFVSNQEYLQDIGELQFLPKLQIMNNSGNYDPNGGGGYYAPTFNGASFADRMDPNSLENKQWFWLTYTAYDNGNGYDPIYALPFSGSANGVCFKSGANGFKVNPYSDDDRVMSAALALTPYDYYIASTNRDVDVKPLQEILLSQMKNNYSCEANPAAMLTPEELFGGIAECIRKQAQTVSLRELKGETNWPKVWDFLVGNHERSQVFWQDDGLICDNNKSFLGVNNLTHPLHGVDRKFLYSFWRECFDNRQQLFLIFVRAEPTSIGGGAAGNVSSAQLGGRAVALVWRDPMPIVENGVTRNPRPSGTLDAKKFREDYKKDRAPHHTRVLFYHQFD